MTLSKPIIIWFRKDFRLADHQALFLLFTGLEQLFCGRISRGFGKGGEVGTGLLSLRVSNPSCAGDNIGLDTARVHTHHMDVGVSHLMAQRLGGAFQRKLAGSVGDIAGQACQRCKKGA